MSKRVPRKLKKKIIQHFGRGTFTGIKLGYLLIEDWLTTSSITKRTAKPFDGIFYHPSQKLFGIRLPETNCYE